MGCAGSQPENPQNGASKEGDKWAQVVTGFIGTVPIFKKLEPKDLEAISNRMRARKFDPQQVIITQGDYGDEFFVVVQGEATVNVNGQVVGELKKGDYFGERAILSSQVRAATITAKTEIKALVLSAEAFGELNLREKVVWTSRAAVQAEKVEVYSQQELVKVEKDDVTMNLIKEAIKNEDTLHGVVDLSDYVLTTLAEVAVLEQYEAGKDVITFGDTVAENYYILASGKVDVQMPKSEGSTEMKSVAQKDAPWSFGSVALLYGTPRTAGINAMSACDVYAINRQAFKQILMEGSAAELDEYITFMDAVDILKELSMDEKRVLAQSLRECSYGDGEMVMKEGDEGDCLYLVYKGELDVYKGASTEKVHQYTSGGFFGERALLNHETRTASVYVAPGSHATLLQIDKASFDLVKKQVGNSLAGKRGSLSGAMEVKTNTQFGKVQRSDLNHLGYLGAGGFGFVSLEQNKNKLEDYYALKGLSKGHLVNSGMKESSIAEKEILMMLDSKYIVILYNTYKDEQNLYFLLEACLAGDLYLVLNQRGLYGKDDCAAYYSAVVIESFVYLHSLRIVYRDLKPENLLMTHDGQAKLCDMGISKVIVGKTYTMCGTPEYFSPEVIKQKGHDFMVDWWALGVFIYELFAGETPFCHDSTLAIYKGINKGIDKVKFHPKAKAHEKLIKDLCQLKPTDRLPSKAGGVGKLKEHNLYKKTNWAELNTKAMKVPYTPNIKPEKATKGRVDMDDIKRLQVKYKDDGTGWDKDF